MTIFPNPTGPYLVGCTEVMSKLGPDRNFFRMFYPASATSDGEKAIWLPAREYAFGSRIFRWFISDARMNAILNANLSPEIEKMPVVVFSHGLGLGGNVYSQICIELASKGMLVAAVEHGDQSAYSSYYLEEDPENKGNLKKVLIPYLSVNTKDGTSHGIRNKQVHQRAEECETTLGHLEEINSATFEGVGTSIDFKQFQGHIDVEKNVVIGHSFGGATAIAAVAKGTKFKVGIGLDSWVAVLEEEDFKNVAHVPFLSINSVNYQKEEDIVRMRYLDSENFGIDVERRLVTLLNSNHLTQSDFILLTKWSWFTRLFRLHGSVDPLVLTKVNNDLVSAFIGKHLGLECGAETDDVVKLHEKHILDGGDVKIDEDKVKQFKQEIISQGSS